MPLIHHSSDDPDHQTRSALLTHALAVHPNGAPIIVMIHGYKFAPGRQGFCPHNDILSLTPGKRERAISWPRHLGVGRSSSGCEPLCIAFGWNARGTVWRAWHAARRAGRNLAALLHRIQRLRPGPCGVIAHSMGARVAICALRNAPEGSVGRLVLMAGAVFRGEALRALDSPAGRQIEVLNITSGENLFYDTLLETAVGIGRRSIGHGLGTAHPRWQDLRIDCAATRGALRGLGHRIGIPKRRVCHWSGYLRPGLFGLYRRWLGQPGQLPLAGLAATLPVPARRGWALSWFTMRIPSARATG